MLRWRWYERLIIALAFCTCCCDPEPRVVYLHLQGSHVIGSICFETQGPDGKWGAAQFRDETGKLPVVGAPVGEGYWYGPVTQVRLKGCK